MPTGSNSPLVWSSVDWGEGELGVVGCMFTMAVKMYLVYVEEETKLYVEEETTASNN